MSGEGLESFDDGRAGLGPDEVRSAATSRLRRAPTRLMEQMRARFAGGVVAQRESGRKNRGKVLSDSRSAVG